MQLARCSSTRARARAAGHIHTLHADAEKRCRYYTCTIVIRMHLPAFFKMHLPMRPPNL